MSVTATELRTAPPMVLRLLPVPISEPPYDDELPPSVRSTAPPLGPLRELAPLLRLVRDLPLDEEPAHVRTLTSDLPPAQPVARTLVQGLLEALAGVRPLTQLRRLTSPKIYAVLETRVPRTPLGSGQRPSTGAVRSVHVQQQDDGIAEVCVTVRRGHRTTAVALRLEGLNGRWCCTELIGV